MPPRSVPTRLGRMHTGEYPLAEVSRAPEYISRAPPPAVAPWLGRSLALNTILPVAAPGLAALPRPDHIAFHGGVNAVGATALSACGAGRAISASRAVINPFVRQRNGNPTAAT